jgi:hypothetical protein
MRRQHPPRDGSLLKFSTVHDDARGKTDCSDSARDVDGGGEVRRMTRVQLHIGT